MNDRFRFRAWNKEEKKMYYDAQNTYDYMAGNPIIFAESFSCLLTNDEEWEVEQCTGLKDKNGNLIYEGDIIHEVDKEAGIDDVSQIVWSQYTCHFMKLDLPETGLDRHCILCEDDSPYIEIIGNIHEQPEQGRTK